VAAAAVRGLRPNHNRRRIHMTRPGRWALVAAACVLTGTAGAMAQATVLAQRPTVTVYKTPT